MKPNELRIGNYVRVGVDWIVQVEQVFKDDKGMWFISYDGGATALEKVFPVPITSNRLVFMGFEKECGAYLKNKSTKSSFLVWQWDVASEFKFSDWAGRAAIEITGLHQLQNLYFALTGEELTMK